MSDDITRITLDTALDADRTDWTRLRAIDDAGIASAMAGDADTFAIDGADAAGAGTARYHVFKDASGDWRWMLEDEKGQRIAMSVTSFASRIAVTGAIDSMRSMLLSGNIKAT